MVLLLICIVWGFSICFFTGLGIGSFLETKNPKEVALGFLAGIMLPPVTIAELILVFVVGLFFIFLVVLADASSRVVGALGIQ